MLMLSLSGTGISPVIIIHYKSLRVKGKIFKMSSVKFTKEELKGKLDGNELDLSMSSLSKVPVRELVSCSNYEMKK